MYFRTLCAQDRRRSGEVRRTKGVLAVQPFRVFPQHSIWGRSCFSVPRMGVWLVECSGLL